MIEISYFSRIERRNLTGQPGLVKSVIKKHSWMKIKLKKIRFEKTTTTK